MHCPENFFLQKAKAQEQNKEMTKSHLWDPICHSDNALEVSHVTTGGQRHQGGQTLLKLNSLLHTLKKKKTQRNKAAS